MKPAVLVISSFVMRGAVGGRASAVPLERAGHPLWLLPTVILPWHPRQGASHRWSPPPEDFRAGAADLARSPRLGEVGAVLTGYFGSAEQVAAAAELVDAVRRANPRALVLCDPVLGDTGGLYLPETVAAAIRDRLLRRADIITPNRYELAWLAGRPLADNAETARAALSLGAPMAFVTSAVAPPGRIGNLLVTAETVRQAEHAESPNAPKGTGDYLAGAFLAALLGGTKPGDAFREAVSDTAARVERAVAAGSDDLPLD